MDLIYVYIVGILISTGIGFLLSYSFPYCKLRKDWVPPVPDKHLFPKLVRSCSTLSQAERLTELYFDLYETKSYYEQCGEALSSKLYYLAFVPFIFYVLFIINAFKSWVAVVFILPAVAVFAFEKAYAGKAVFAEDEVDLSANKKDFSSSNDFIDYWSKVSSLLPPLVNPRFSFYHKTIPDCNSFFAIEFILFLFLALDSVFHMF